MPNTLTFAEIDGQHIEILPARTVLSTMIDIGDMLNSGDTTAHSGDIKASQEAKDVKGDVWQFQYNVTGYAEATGGSGFNDLTVGADK